MKGRFLVLFLLCLFLLSFSSCDYLPFSKKPKEKAGPTEVSMPITTGKVVAMVNNYPFTLEDLDQEVETYNSSEIVTRQPELKIDTRDKKIGYLKDEMIRRVLLYQEALDRGLNRNPDVQKALEKTKVQLLAFQIVREETEKVNVTSSEIEQYYNTLPEVYKKEPEERKIREIAVSSQSQAKDLLIKLLQGEDFASLARQHSKAASAGRGGDLGFITINLEEKFKQFWEVAFSDALEVGQVSSVFKGPEGYYIIKLEAKRGGKQRSLSDMWEDLKTLLTITRQRQRIDDLVGELSRNAKIEVKEDLIK